jgi:hypothetical protein
MVSNALIRAANSKKGFVNRRLMRSPRAAGEVAPIT